MKTLKEYIYEAKDKGVAIGHFNISNLEGFHAVIDGAKELGLPVVIGLSEGEEDSVGIHEAVALVKGAQARGIPVFLNADHHYSFDRVKACIDAGFDAVIIDLAEKTFEENISTTKMCVEYARASGREVLVEAEIGYIGSGSSIKDEIPEGAGVKTTPLEAKEFVEKTGVDLLAPSVGSIHGIIKSGKPHIDTDLVKEISDACGIPLVLHGGSGLRDEDFTGGIKAGISMVHINTELRVAYTEALRKALEEKPDETTPYKYGNIAKEAMKEVVVARLKLFNNL
jgi:fructose-bisphosphate aldolase class II